ncbi:MAG: DUF2760 domain-containing protein [Methylococcaceae bacterium]|nr:DUF2760 domain-containing protein [Methylococcaceae bacterium]
MNFDFTTIADKLDTLHLALAGVALIEAVLLVILLSLIVIGLMRNSLRPSEAAARSGKPVETAIPVAAPEPSNPEKKPAPRSTTLREARPEAALQLLGLLQQEARFIDFVKEDIQSYSDAKIGAATRVVHEGCHKVLHNHFDFSPVRLESENSRVTVQAGFDPATIRLTGNIVGKAPFNGTLVHRGWRVTDIRLPKLAENHNVKIVATAEVEL